IVFFFSSRRRHTRFSRDWSSNVCSSDLLDITREAKKTGQKKRLRTLKDLDRAALLLARACSLLLDDNADDPDLRRAIFSCVPKKIGRASCRERVWGGVVGGGREEENDG